MLGHIDRKGLRDDAPARRGTHLIPCGGPDGGCSKTDLRGAGSDGLFLLRSSVRRLCKLAGVAAGSARPGPDTNGPTPGSRR